MNEMINTFPGPWGLYMMQRSFLLSGNALDSIGARMIGHDKSRAFAPAKAKPPLRQRQNRASRTYGGERPPTSLQTGSPYYSSEYCAAYLSTKANTLLSCPPQVPITVGEEMTKRTTAEKSLPNRIGSMTKRITTKKSRLNGSPLSQISHSAW